MTSNASNPARGTNAAGSGKCSLLASENSPNTARTNFRAGRTPRAKGSCLADRKEPPVVIRLRLNRFRRQRCRRKAPPGWPPGGESYVANAIGVNSNV
jgi:hypothetical protein